MPKAPSRADQPATSGFGKHFTSPPNPRDKRKTSARFLVPGHDARLQLLQDQMRRLQSLHSPAPDTPPHTLDDPMDGTMPFSELGGPFIPNSAVDEYQAPKNSSDPATSSIHESHGAEEVKEAKRLVPDTKTFRLYDKWQKLLPSLEDSLLEYTTSSIGRVLLPVESQLCCRCSQPSCTSKITDVVCLFYDRKSCHPAFDAF